MTLPARTSFSLEALVMSCVFATAAPKEALVPSTAAEKYLQDAAAWKPIFCTWGGALAVLSELAAAMNELAKAFGGVEGLAAPDRCWWHALWGWERRSALLREAWAVDAGTGTTTTTDVGDASNHHGSQIGFGGEQTSLATRSASSESQRLRAWEHCDKVGKGWSMQRISLDIPRYVYDVRGCGRGRRELWDPIEELIGRLKEVRGDRSDFRFAMGSPVEVHLCLPWQYCTRAEAASGPVVLWLASAFSLQNVFNNLPPLLLAHANVSSSRAEAGPAAKGSQPNEAVSARTGNPCRARGATAAGSWVYVRSQGRLGNVLLDLVNGLAVAVQTGRQGVFVESSKEGFALGSGAAAAANTTVARLADSLLGLVGTYVEVPRPLRHDRELLAVLGGHRKKPAECAWDGQLTKLTRVSAVTHWAATALGAFCGVFPSCVLPLRLRRRVLRTAVLPLVRRRCRRSVPAYSREVDPADLLTIHLRGGDAVPAGSPEHAQPPCAFYEHALSAGKFRRVRVIAEDAKNPCLVTLLQQQRPEAIAEARLGGTLAEDVCALLSARSLFLAASTLSTNIALLSDAEQIFAPMPSDDFAPGPVSFGFGASRYLEELCHAFGDNVMGFWTDRSYFLGEAAVDEVAAKRYLNAGGAPVGTFSGVPIERTRSHRILHPLECTHGARLQGRDL